MIGVKITHCHQHDVRDMYSGHAPSVTLRYTLFVVTFPGFSPSRARLALHAAEDHVNTIIVLTRGRTSKETDLKKWLQGNKQDFECPLKGFLCHPTTYMPDWDMESSERLLSRLCSPRAKVSGAKRLTDRMKASISDLLDVVWFLSKKKTLRR